MTEAEILERLRQIVRGADDDPPALRDAFRELAERVVIAYADIARDLATPERVPDPDPGPAPTLEEAQRQLRELQAGNRALRRAIAEQDRLEATGKYLRVRDVIAAIERGWTAARAEFLQAYDVARRTGADQESARRLLAAAAQRACVHVERLDLPRVAVGAKRAGTGDEG